MDGEIQLSGIMRFNDAVFMGVRTQISLITNHLSLCILINVYIKQQQQILSILPDPILMFQPCRCLSPRAKIYVYDWVSRSVTTEG